MLENNDLHNDYQFLQKILEQFQGDELTIKQNLEQVLCCNILPEKSPGILAASLYAAYRKRGSIDIQWIQMVVGLHLNHEIK